MSTIEPAIWDAMAGVENPFLSHGFLSTLEDSGCVGEGTAWIPRPLLLYRAGSQQPIAAAPAYLKLDSTGEYIFDYGWADAHQRWIGSSYYPKLQVAVPFTPVPGPRLLLHPSLSVSEQPEIQTALLEGMVSLVEQGQLSSAHITFCGDSESRIAASTGHYFPRLGEQYHWLNEGYESFEQFLQTLSSRKRKAIRRERRIAAEHPVSLHVLHGDEVTVEQWETFFQMYETTSLQKWGRPYLNRAFFPMLGQRLGPKVVLILVRREDSGRWVAGAWNLRGSRALFGRNWGCLETFDMLHFEVCYYQAIEYAIAHGLERVEAGAQGFHKLQRGYRPTAIHSAHHIANPQFARAIADHLEQEREEQTQRLAELEEFTPFRKETL